MRTPEAMVTACSSYLQSDKVFLLQTYLRCRGRQLESDPRDPKLQRQGDSLPHSVNRSRLPSRSFGQPISASSNPPSRSPSAVLRLADACLNAPAQPAAAAVAPENFGDLPGQLPAIEPGVSGTSFFRQRSGRLGRRPGAVPDDPARSDPHDASRVRLLPHDGRWPSASDGASPFVSSLVMPFVRGDSLVLVSCSKRFANGRRSSTGS